MPKFFKSLFFSLLSLVTAFGLTLSGCSSPVSPSNPGNGTSEGDLTVKVDSSAADLETLSKIDVRVFVKDTERTPSSFSGGNFNFKSLPAGKWTVLAEGKGLDQSTFYQAAITVTIPASAPVNLVLAPFAVLPVKVVNPSVNYGLNDALFLKTATDGADIFYTTDNTQPIRNVSAKYLPASGITLTGSMKIRAQAFKDGLAFSPEGVFTVLVDQSKAPMPKFTPAGGKFSSSVQVSISGAGTIIYTDNGDDPRTSFNKKTYTAPITVAASSLLRAYSTGVSGLSDSSEARAEFVIGGNPVPVATPSFDPVPGTYTTTQSLKIASEAGASVLYTLDNSGNFSNYTGAIALAAVGGVKTVYTVKAYATMTGKENSKMIMGEFVIDPSGMQTSATPTISPASGSLKKGSVVTITGAAGSKVYVTTDGTAPTTSLIPHDSPYSLVMDTLGSINVKAIALETGKLPSSTASAVISVYNTNVTPDPVFSKTAGTYTTDIEVALTGEGTIYYKKNATDAYAVYSAPIPVKGNGTVMTIYAYAQAVDKEPSSPINSTYSIVYNQDPVVNATPDTGTFDTSIAVTLTAMNPANGTYRVNDGTALNFNSGDQISIGADAAAGSSLKLTVSNSGTSKDFYYTKNSDNTAYNLFFKHTTAGQVPEAYVWVRKDAQGNYLDPNGSAGTVVEVFGTWAATTKMTAVDGLTGWYKADLKAKSIPKGTKVGIIFKIGSTKLSGNDNQYRTITGWCQMVNSAPSWTDDNPDGPIADANPGSQNFSTTLNVTLIAKNPANGQYKLGSGALTPYTDGQVITITAPNLGDVVTLTVSNTGVTKTFNYTKTNAPSNVKLYVKKAGATAPAIWFWETAGLARAIQTLEKYTWTGPKMNADAPDWWSWEIPATYNPVNSLGLQIDGANIAALPVPAGATALSGNWFYDGTSWSSVDPREVVPPTVSMNPDGGFVEVTPFDISVSASNDTRDPTTAVEYQIGTGAWTAVSNNKITGVGANLTTNGQTVTVGLRATNTKGTTTITKTFTKGVSPTPAFSWDNASVYFVITDRFKDGDPTNNNSYGRPQTDKMGKNIGTFHGGDLKGLTAKLNEGYFTNLGVNAIWITAPYEQMHGWVQGDGNSFYHYAYHGYYVRDYTNMDANMGSKDDLKTFIDLAHTKGIRVVFDIVMNHSGYAPLQDLNEINLGVLKTGWESADITSIHSYIDYTSTNWSKWWGIPWIRAGFPGHTAPGGSEETKSLAGLPDFITESPSSVALPDFLKNKADYGAGYRTYTVDKNKSQRLVNWISEWLAQWVKDYGVDGFRVDTAKHVERASWGILKDKAVQALKDWRAANPSAPGAEWTDDFWTTAENNPYGSSYSSDYHGTGKFDSIINFDFRGVATGATGNLGNMENTYADYANRINGSKTDKWNVLSFLDNHDLGAVQFNGDYERQKKLGSALLMAPGGVQIYYGDEYGRVNGDGGSDKDQGSRSSMDWSAVTTQLNAADSTLKHWQKLGQFRNRHVAIGGGDHKTTSATSGYAFTRVWGSDKAAVVLGASGTVEVTVSTLWTDGTVLTNGYDGATATVAGGKVSFSAGSNGTILIEKK